MRRILVCVLVLVLALSATNAGAQVRAQRPNLIGGEILGRGLFLTVNYERFLVPSVGLGAGFMGIGADDGAVILAPVYASFVPGNIHSPYFSAGITVVAGKGDAKDFESTLLLNASIGYQFQSESGLFVRPLFSMIVPTENEDDFIIWPGITIGGSF